MGVVLDRGKREEWESHIHFCSKDEMIDLFCKFLNCDRGSQLGISVKRFVDKEKSRMRMVAFWFGHMRGDFYGNFSIRTNGNVIEKSPGFHVDRDYFDWVLGLPLDWHKIIDSRIVFEDNCADCGVDLVNGEFVDGVVPVGVLSPR